MSNNIPICLTKVQTYVSIFLWQCFYFTFAALNFWCGWLMEGYAKREKKHSFDIFLSSTTAAEAQKLWYSYPLFFSSWRCTVVCGITVSKIRYSGDPRYLRSFYLWFRIFSVQRAAFFEVPILTIVFLFAVLYFAVQYLKILSTVDNEGNLYFC